MIIALSIRLAKTPFSRYFTKMAFSSPPQPAPQWNFSPEEIVAKAKETIEKTRLVEDKVAALENPTFENAIATMAQDHQSSTRIANVLTFYQHVSTSKEHRDAGAEAERLFNEAGVESSMREDVFKIVHQVYESKPQLEPESMRLLEKTDLDYRRAGLALKKEDQEKLKSLKVRLSDLSIQFSQRLGEETGGVFLTKEQLVGLPDDVLNYLATKEQDGKTLYKVTFKYTDIGPALKYCKLEETRKSLFIGDSSKAAENAKVLDEAVIIRRDIAKLLGYKTWTDFILEEKMAKNTSTVTNFLDDLRNKLTPTGEKEVTRLLQLKKEDVKKGYANDGDVLCVWDYGFYNRVLLESEYQVDEQLIAEYFPMESTIAGFLRIFETLFSLKFDEITDSSQSVWHEDCKQYAVWRSDTKGFLGWLYLDLFPRDGKYRHAADFNLGPGYTDENGNQVYPSTALVCNFTKPTPEKPSLLKHSEVITIFHEMGHAIHDIVSVTKYGRFHGTEVPGDFVEAPSQMLENWCWNKKVLQDLSHHYQRGEPLKEELIDKLVASKLVDIGLSTLRQIFFGMFDMKIHSLIGDQVADTTKEYNMLRQQIGLVQNGNVSTNGQASFGHMMGGYDAGYYGYLYSQQISTDMFYTKFKVDLMNSTVGSQYRDTILVPGGSCEMMDNLKLFLGREPNNTAFLEDLGICSSTKGKYADVVDILD